jgi:malonyl-CoA O-methyltransferase
MNDVELVRYRKDSRRVARNFARAAPAYDVLAQFQHEVGRRLMEWLEPINARPGFCLDLGSGTGFVSKALRSRYAGAACVEVDLAEEMLRKARPRWPWRRRGRCWICADAERLPFPDGHFDLAASNLMLQWCNIPERALAESFRILRPGGLLLFTTLGPDTLRELRECWRAVDDDVHVNAFMDIHDLGTALTVTGYGSPVLEAETFTLTYDDGLAMMRDLKRLGAANANLGRPRSLTGKGRIASMLAHYERYRNGGRLPATYEVIYGHAWRPDHQKVFAPAGTVATVPVASIRRRSA